MERRRAHGVLNVVPIVLPRRVAPDPSHVDDVPMEVLPNNDHGSGVRVDLIDTVKR